MRFLRDEASCAVTAEIDHADAMVTASRPKGRNVLVSPTPELDGSKARRRHTRYFLFGGQTGIQGLNANGGGHCFKSPGHLKRLSGGLNAERSRDADFAK